ncbi:hypothetical protein F5Y14DRAFT_436420 [Nemania sp. NC0429]|nr:hypothetical protein F5Y14DRAFT_436420 [Nemania sp. NC0429]
MRFYMVFNYIELFTIHRSITTTSLTIYLIANISASSIVSRVAAAILAYPLLALHTTAGPVVFSLLFGAGSGAFTGLPATGLVTLSYGKGKMEPS